MHQKLKKRFIDEKRKTLFTRHKIDEDPDLILPRNLTNLDPDRNYIKAIMFRYDKNLPIVVDWCVETLLNVLWYTNEKQVNEALNLLYQCIRVARALLNFTMLIEMSLILANFLLKME